MSRSRCRPKLFLSNLGPAFIGFVLIQGDFLAKDAFSVSSWVAVETPAGCPHEAPEGSRSLGVHMVAYEVQRSYRGTLAVPAPGPCFSPEESADRTGPARNPDPSEAQHGEPGSPVWMGQPQTLRTRASKESSRKNQYCQGPGWSGVGWGDNRDRPPASEEGPPAHAAA